MPSSRVISRGLSTAPLAPRLFIRLNQVPTNPHGDGRYIPALDGWRAVAILLVMAFHGLYNTDTTGSHLLASAEKISARVGALGVLIFFAISGYIITSRLYPESSGGRISLRVFFAKRAFRILPPMFLYLGVVATLGLTHVIQLQTHDWAAPVFLSNYFPGSWVTKHFWSLSVEEHFYLFWPFCIVLMGWRRAIGVGVAIMTAVGVWRAYHLAHFPVSPDDPTYEAVRGLFLSHTETRIDYIMAGCILALLVIYYPATLRFLKRCGSGPGQLLLAVLLIATTRAAKADLRSLQAVVIALVVIGTSLTSSWFANRVLSTRVMLFLGKLSYSLYLWQQLFLAHTSLPWMQSIYALPLKFTLAIFAAYLSYNFVERPLIRKGRRVIDSWQQMAPAAAGAIVS
jgi:peptidoglycan/LPS O-acetylase OafA/YrhL